MMKYVFGPVPSRRLGKSLGIDPIPGKMKTCNWNCVYCQLGRTIPLTIQRMDYHPRQEILREVRQAIQSRQDGEIDWVTFVGSGETLLYESIGWIIREIKKLTGIPVAVITNGSLLYLEEVRQALMDADAVLPTLDAGTADLYRKINRPHPAITFERLVDGLAVFRTEYSGNLWLEVMLVSGLNDTPQALADIARVLDSLCPDAVHINIPTRPAAETWVQPPSGESLETAVNLFGDIARLVVPVHGSFERDSDGSMVEAVMAIIRRHPMRQDELERTLERWSAGQVGQVFEDLRTRGDVQVVERQGERFWSAASAFYPENSQSQKIRPGKIRPGEIREQD